MDITSYNKNSIVNRGKFRAWKNAWKYRLTYIKCRSLKYVDDFICNLLKDTYTRYSWWESEYARVPSRFYRHFKVPLNTIAFPLYTSAVNSRVVSTKKAIYLPLVLMVQKNSHSKKRVQGKYDPRNPTINCFKCTSNILSFFSSGVRSRSYYNVQWKYQMR